MKRPCIGRTLHGMKPGTLTLAGPVAFLLLLARPACADELLRFKSGYEMMVLSHREEGKMVVVTLDGGG